MAKSEAQMAFDEATRAKTESEGTRGDLEQLLNQISSFLEINGAKPEDIQNVRLPGG